MSTPAVSIVIPCYNGHAFLAQAVESALRQDLESKEVIVIDDGSTAPETAEALARLPEGVEVIRQENCGLSAARNRGFEEARGRYVLPLDCDDWIEPDYARRALELIGGREDAFVYPWVAIFGEYETVLRRRWDPFEQLFINQIECSILVPATLWRRVGGYDETMRLGLEDWDFNIRLGLARAEALCLPEPMLHYRLAAGGMWQSTTRRQYGAIWRGIQKKHPDVYSVRGFWPECGLDRKKDGDAAHGSCWHSMARTDYYRERCLLYCSYRSLSLAAYVGEPNEREAS